MTQTLNIPGLHFIPFFLDSPDQSSVVARIEEHPWERSGGLRRLVQQYGYAYQHGNPRQPPQTVEQLPGWLQTLAEMVARAGGFTRRPDQVIINRYLPGEGISAHVDSVAHFGPTIASLSLRSQVPMSLTLVGDRSSTHELLLPPGSLLVLTGGARYNWKHSIAARHVDVIANQPVARGLRYSVTFRTMRA